MIDQLRIADIPISIHYQSPAQFNGEIYESFQCDCHPEVNIHLKDDHFPKINLQNQKPLFDSQSVWRLYLSGQTILFIQKSVIDDFSNPLLAAFFKDHYQSVDLYIRTNHNDPEDVFNPYPLDYPLGQILIISLLAQKRGVMFHACGVDDQGNGYLFTGNSTHGKSTMANLWMQNDGRILNDDRVIVRQRGDTFRIFGTPWHGDFPVTSNRDVPLKKIFILKHDKKNQVKPVDGSMALSMLLTRIFPVIWDKTGMEFTLDFCTRLISKVPCYQLGFKPDSDIIDFIRCVP